VAWSGRWVDKQNKCSENIIYLYIYIYSTVAIAVKALEEGLEQGLDGEVVLELREIGCTGEREGVLYLRGRS
jgi:hypothetical protein